MHLIRRLHLVRRWDMNRTSSLFSWCYSIINFTQCFDKRKNSTWCSSPNKNAIFSKFGLIWVSLSLVGFLWFKIVIRMSSLQFKILIVQVYVCPLYFGLNNPQVYVDYFWYCNYHQLLQINQFQKTRNILVFVPCSDFFWLLSFCCHFLGLGN